MLAPIIRRSQRSADPRQHDLRENERGVTLALVAASIVGLIAMASLSIDIGTFYQAKAEAQRTADAAALTAAREISISGMTGDPNNSASSWQAICGGASSAATLAATAIADVQQNFIAGVTPKTIAIGYGPGGIANADCSSLVGTSFAVNPTVTVKVTSATLPIFFGRVFGLLGSNYGNTTVSASATAEVYNPSGSVAQTGAMIPVWPHCVKPWIVPNQDPGNTGLAFVNATTGAINHPGISPAGLIGESFNLTPDCGGNTGACVPTPNPPTGTAAFTLDYVPALVSNGSPAKPICADADNYQEAVGGCDQNTPYQCGMSTSTAPSPTQVDLTENPSGPSGDSAVAVECLIHEAAAGSASGQDVLTPATYPFQIQAGTSNPLNATGVTGLISSSDSIVTVPIYDSGPGTKLNPGQQVAIVGFLQVFINYVNTDPPASLNVTVMNVAGCGNGSAGTPATSVTGTSPVPIRLITPP
jgi:Flp pilus assembly protein TadG